MAKKISAATANKSASTTSNDDSGWVTENANTSAPWWSMEKGNILRGKLLGGFDMPDQFNKGARRRYVQVELLSPTQVAQKGEDETIEAETGDVVSVGITSQMEALWSKHVPMVDAGAEVHIRLEVTGDRVKTTSGNRMWPVSVGYKNIQPPKGPVIARASLAAANSVARAPQTFENESGF